MTYFETPGVLSDVAQYMAMYYNPEVFERVYSQFSNPQHYYEFFNQVKKEMGELPPALHPFAYTSDKTYCIINNIIFNEPFETISLEGFLDYLRSEEFKLKTYNHWFSINNDYQAVEELQSLDLLELILKLDVSERMKYLLALFFQDFERYRDELVDLVQKLYRCILHLRSRYDILLTERRSYFDSLLFYHNFSSNYNLDISEFKYTLMVMNNLSYMFCVREEYIAVGVNCYNAFHKNIDIYSFAHVYEDPVRVEIVNYISQYSCIERKDVIKFFGESKFPRHMFNQHLNVLSTEGIISCRYCNSECYLSLNEDYFKNLPGIYNQAFAKLTGAKKDEA